MPESKVLDIFFYKPMSSFGVRELSRQTHLDTKTILKYLKEFIKLNLVVRKTEKKKFPYYEANRLSPYYRFEKSTTFIRKIHQSNLIKYLEKELNPKVIVLFGSIAKGTYHQMSDIDIFIQKKYHPINLQKYEAKLGHKINILFEESTKDLSKGLLENIYNGKVLSGKLEVID